jgi:hypothetical protein
MTVNLNNIYECLSCSAQILDVVKQEWSRENAWTEFDQSVRDQITASLAALSGTLAQSVQVTDVRWAVNVLLEKIADGFEKWETADIWRSDAAAYVRARKHDIASQPSPAAPVETPPRAWLEAKAEVDAGWPERCSAGNDDEAAAKLINQYLGMSDIDAEDAAYFRAVMRDTRTEPQTVWMPMDTASPEVVTVIERAINSDKALGKWMSAALEDDKVCAEMKADILEWFEAHKPTSAVSRPESK